MHISLFNLNISIRLVGINSQISMVIFCCIENYLNLNWLNLLMPFDYKHWKCHETAQLLKFHHTLKYWKKKVHVRQQHGEEQVSQVTQSFDEEKKHVEREWKLCIISMFFISCLKLAKCLIAFHTLHVAGCYCTLFLSLSLSVCHCITIFSLCLPQYIINHEYQLKATAAVVNSCKSQFSIFFYLSPCQ